MPTHLITIIYTLTNPIINQCMRNSVTTASNMLMILLIGFSKGHLSRQDRVAPLQNFSGLFLFYFVELEALLKFIVYLLIAASLIGI